MWILDSLSFLGFSFRFTRIRYPRIRCCLRRELDHAVAGQHLNNAGFMILVTLAQAVAQVFAESGKSFEDNPYVDRLQAVLQGYKKQCDDLHHENG